MPSLRADGAFKPENNPFLELGQRLAVWGGITSWLIMHTEHPTFLSVMNIG